MSKNKGTLVVAPVRPNDSNDLIATAFSNEIKGGHHGYATLSERDNLIEARRDWGMFVTIYNDGGNNGVYKLEYNYIDTDLTNNSNWVPFSGGALSSTTWINSVASKSTVPPVSPSDGDRYLIGTTASGDWFTNEQKITQYSTTLSDWIYTTPDDGYSVIVNNEPDSIYRYYGTYSSGSWVKQTFGGLSNKYLIQNESIEVPFGYQYFIYGDLIIGTAGSLTNYGEVITLNGDLIIESTGTFSNYGLYNSSSIDVSKFSATFSIAPGATVSISHALNSYDLMVNLLEFTSPSTLVPVQMDYNIMDLNTLQLTLSLGAPYTINAKIIIMK